MSTNEVRRALIGRGSVFVAGRAGIVIVQLVALPLVTRALAPEEYGTVALSILVSTILVNVGDAGLPLASSRVYFDLDGGPERARALIGLTAVLAVVVTAIAHLTGSLWTNLFESIEYDAVMALGVWLTVPSMLRNATLFLLRAEDRAGAHTAVVVISAAGGQVLGLALLLGFDGGGAGYVGGILAGSVVGAVVGLWLTRAVFPRPSLLGGLRSILTFSLPTVPRSVSRSLLSSGDRIIVERFAGLAEVGRYQVGYRIGSLAMVVTGELARALVPIVFDTAKREATLRDAQTVVVRLASWIALGVAFSSPVLLRIIAPSGYQPDALSTVTALVAAAAIPHAFGIVAGLGLVRVKRTGPLAWVTLFAAVSNLVLAAVGVELFGLPGAATATIVAFTIESALIQRAFARVIRGSGPDRRLLGFAVAAFAACVVAAVIPTEGTLWMLVRLTGGIAAATGLVSEGLMGWRGSPSNPEGDPGVGWVDEE